MIFKNRRHAGQLLGNKLAGQNYLNPIVLALPRGGVPVAAEVARALSAPLDVLLVKKVGVPFQSELAGGAICEDSEPLWNTSILSHLGLGPHDFSEIIGRQREKIKNQNLMFRAGKNLPELSGRDVIIVDDGLATGATALAATDYVLRHNPARVILAMPVAAPRSEQRFSKKVEIIALQEPEELTSVGQWYDDFIQVEDKEVVEILKEFESKNPVVSVPEMKFTLDGVNLYGDLTAPQQAKALILFAHGSGSSRKSTRNQFVAHKLNNAGFATLLFDLLTEEEAQDRRKVFDIHFLSRRLVHVTQIMRQQSSFSKLPFAYFGASTGAAAAIMATAHLPEAEKVFTIVSRGGRPDLAGASLRKVTIPTLLLVGGEDYGVIELNHEAKSQMSKAKLIIVPGATHLFEEPGALEEVASLAEKWFTDHLKATVKGPEDEKAGEMNL